MIKNKTIGVVVPAHNEELLIAETLSGMPDFVDKIIVVNDASTDKTKEIILQQKDLKNRIVLVDHLKNKGLGASLADGYLKALELNIDCIAVMAGDNQMDPNDLESIVMPIVDEKVDYSKGSRLLAKDVAKIMPRYRFIGNIIATFLTKFATGYWQLVDPQCGYTAISNKALAKIDIATLKKGYGYNADILFRLNFFNFKITDVEVKPVYGREKSGIKFFSYTMDVSSFLLKLFWRRLSEKYFFRDFNPLGLFYLFSFINLILIIIPLTIRFFMLYFQTHLAPSTTLIILSFSLMMGFFSFGFAIWLDMESNKDLFVR
ncbi:MAG: glycosyltransferase family 2 protein [Candidatus Berkelbacteria bacterium]